MRKILFISVFIGFLLSINSLQAEDTTQAILSKPNPNFYEIQQSRLAQFEVQNASERRGWKQFKRWEYFWQQRVYPTGEFPNGYKIFEDYVKYSKKINQNKLQGNQWELLGPINTPKASDVREQGMGRINVVRINPNNENELWIGSASGGVWRSINNGNTWQNFPFTNFLSLGVSDIAIAQTNTNIVYVATGDADGSIGSGGKDFYSIGLIKTTDAGATWVNTGFSRNLFDSKLITRILVHPDNENIVLIATNSGIYKSTDGGITWALKSSEGAFIDMEFNPADPDIVYASTYSYNGSSIISVSTDNGENWKKVYTSPDANRLAIAVTPANSDYVYCLASNKNTYGFEGFVRSTDKGNSWTQTASVPSHPNILGWYDGSTNDARGQGGYDLALCVSPKNTTLIYTGGVNIWKSNDLGNSFTPLTNWTSFYNLPYVHADIHNFEFSPSGNRLYVTNDGGISVSTDQGSSWRDISNGLSITQFYKMGTSDNDLNSIIGGCQDNGTSLYTGNGNWQHVYPSDGMDCAIDPTNSNRIYVSIYNGIFYRSDNKGKSFAKLASNVNEYGGWVTPLVLNPLNPKVLFAGYQNVWKNDNYGGGNWTRLSSFGSNQTLVAIAVAPSDTNVIYAANYSDLYASYNGGYTWNSIYTSSSSSITSIAVDPQDPKRLWVTKSGFTPSDKVLEINNGEVSNLSGNLPNVPVNAIVYQKNSPDRLFIGTDIGVFYTDYSSAYWEKYGDDMPNVVINDIEINYGANSQTKLRAATYGRGIWEADVINCNYQSPTITYTGATSFCEGDSVILSVDLPDQPNDAEQPQEPLNYIWSNGSTSKSIVVKESGAYSVIATYPDGCKAKSKAVTVNVVPQKDISVTSGTGYFGLCGDNDSLELRANLGFSEYEWSNGMTGRKIMITEPGDYYVTGFGTSGCPSKSIIYTVGRYDFPEKPTITRDSNNLIASSSNTYQWYRNGMKIFGSIDQIYKIRESDSASFLQVEITNQGGCKAISDSFYVDQYLKNEVGVNEIDYTIAVDIIPNPTNGNTLIRANNFDNGQIKIEIKDLLGKLIFSKEIYANGDFEMQIDLNQYAAGEYFIVIKSQNHSITKKIVKQ